MWGRLAHFRRITRWGWFVIYELGWVAVFTNIDLIIGKYGSEQAKVSWERFTHPHWGWRIWLIGALVIALVLMVEGSYRALREEEDKLKQEIAKRGRPEVIVTCDWPSNAGGSKIDALAKRNLVVKALTDIAALNVEIGDVILGKGTAHFKSIPLLERDSPQQVLSTIERANGSPVLTALAWNLETLIYDSYNDTVTDISKAWSPPTTIIASYMGADGRFWESVNELSYELFLQKGEMKHLEIREAQKH